MLPAARRKPPPRYRPWAKLPASSGLRALRRSPTPKRVGRVCPVGHATAPTPSHPHRQRRVARTAPSDTHAARPPFHPRSTVAVAAGAHDGSQQLHATLTPSMVCKASVKRRCDRGTWGAICLRCPPSPARRTALNGLVTSVAGLRAARYGARRGPGARSGQHGCMGPFHARRPTADLAH